MALRAWSISFLLTVIAVAMSYEWLDRSLALFAHSELRQIAIFARLTLLPEPLTLLAILALLTLGLRGLTGRSLSKFQTAILLCSVSLIVAGTIKNQLKIVFGRTWPETWINGNPSFIHDGIYGFNPFHAGTAFESFPSGHTTAICAVISVLWISYPRWRVVYVLCVAAVAIGLLGANYHFLSDVIAGGFVGVSTGWMTISLYDAGSRWRRRAEHHSESP